MGASRRSASFSFNDLTRPQSLAVFNMYSVVAMVYCGSSSFVFGWVLHNSLLGIIHGLGLLIVLVNYLALLRTNNFAVATSILLAVGTAAVFYLFLSGGLG